MRARSIKPSFFTNDDLAECQPLARILFAGLWCIADRAGRLEDRPKRIKAELLPYDSCEVDALLDELAVRGFIIRYDAAGVGYIQVVNFERHQDPHVKEKASTIPAPCEHGTSTVQKPLTPDSGLLTPDSKTSREPPKAVSKELDPPDGVLPHVWRDWQRHRGKPLSKESLRRQTEKLAELRAMGHDPNAVILQSIERGWSGLFEVKPRAPPGGRDPTLAEKRAANIAALTGKANVIESVARVVDSEAVCPPDGRLRIAGSANVG